MRDRSDVTASYQSKIVDLASLRRRIEEARAAGRVVVQCHGCFDIVHPGHVRYLEFARRQGDLLVVSLTGDAQVGKGEDRPYIPQDLRAENLAALEFVDLVYINPDATAVNLLGQVRPDIYVKGAEYEHSRDPRFEEERRVVESCGGRIIFSSGDVVFSSTHLIGRIAAGEGEGVRLALTCSRYGVDQTALRDLCARFSDRRVVVIGDVLLDRYVDCDAVGVASEAPVMSLTQLQERTYVGGAGIVARHLAALGAEVTLVSRAGVDPASGEVRVTLDREGVRHELLPLHTPLPQKTRFLADDVKLFKLDQVHHRPLDSKEEEDACRTLMNVSRGADAVIICDFGCGMITGRLLARVLPQLRKNVPFLAADVSGKRANLLHFREVDLLCPTEREMRAALNDYDAGLSNAVWQLLNLTQVRQTIITLGKRGLVTFERPTAAPGAPGWAGRLRSEALPSFAPHAVDALGAGDALLATATLALTGGANLVQAAYLASGAAALEVITPGNVPVLRERLMMWIDSRRELALRTRDASRRDIDPPRADANPSALRRPQGVSK